MQHARNVTMLLSAVETWDDSNVTVVDNNVTVVVDHLKCDEVLAQQQCSKSAMSSLCQPS